MTKYFGSGTVVATSTGDIGQIRSVSGPEVDFGGVDTTTMDSSSNYRTFVAGLGDPGEFTIELVYDPTMDSHRVLAAAALNLTAKSFTVSHGTSKNDTDTFTAFIKGISREIPLDDVITSEVALRVTGKPGYTT